MRFKPCFKWVLPKISFLVSAGSLYVEKVLNLVLNGYSLKFFTRRRNLEDSLISFKPCFKWLLPKINGKSDNKRKNDNKWKF